MTTKRITAPHKEHCSSLGGRLFSMDLRTSQSHETRNLAIIGTEAITGIGGVILCGGNLMEGKGSVTGTVAAGVVALGSLIDMHRHVNKIEANHNAPTSSNYGQVIETTCVEKVE